MSASAADRIAGLVAQPEDYQECRGIEGRVVVCVFAVHAELLDGAVEPPTPVAAALPSNVGPLTVRQVYDDDLERLPRARVLRTGGCEERTQRVQSGRKPP